MTPEQAAAEILIVSLSRAHQISAALFGAAVMLTGVALWKFAAWQFNRRDKMRFLESRDAEARALVEDAHEALSRVAAEKRAAIGVLREVRNYFMDHRPTFDDKEREPLSEKIDEILGRNPPLQIDFKRAPVENPMMPEAPVLEAARCA